MNYIYKYNPTHMKKFIFLSFLLLIVTLSALSQTEQQQKLNIRNNVPSAFSSPSPSSSSKITETELFQKQDIRTESTRPRTTSTYSPRPRWNGYNRWNSWGAPYSYRSYSDLYFFDRWGYRTPYRVYENHNGTKDTVVSKKKKVRLGLNFSTNNEIGGWFTIGNSIYFKGQFNKIISRDKSEFYTHPDVNFYNASVVWGDRQLDDIMKGWNVYMGVGREFKHFGVNLSLGVGKEESNYQFFDEYYTLSNNGKYSFRNFVDDYITVSFGLTHDYNFLSLSADFDPIRKYLYVGVGFNF